MLCPMKMRAMKNNKSAWWAIGLVLTGCAVVKQNQIARTYGKTATEERSRLARLTKGIDFQTRVRPVFENRCVVCHACYDSPCQLNLSSYQGLERGATKKKVYDTGRLVAAEPTRLDMDARTAEEWRHKDFYAVLNERTQTPEFNRAASVLARMLNLKASHPLPKTPVLPESFDFSLDRKQVCPTIVEFDSFEKEHPLWGMPYGLPGLSKDQSDLVMKWVEQGAPYADPPALSPAYEKRIARWEAFLNGESNKEQLMSRYIYEHLFLGHFYFDDLPKGEFFDLVRSKTPPGQPLEIVTARRVYNDPGVSRVYYRFHRVESTIVAKRHLPYALNAKRMARWKALFLETPYAVDQLPGYEEAAASNPFATFKGIPVRSRYEFMLDEAQFTIMGFIKGPVCRGQVALNVIDDHFWMFFVNPAAPDDQKMTDFLAEHSDYLALPATVGSQAAVAATWVRFSSLQKKYLEKKADYIRTNWKDPSQFTLKTIWDGGGTNPNAAVTVFRHFDSATVVKGLVGEKPKTSLVLGYALLERVHYLLVAGYDVYGNVGHQVSTRLYMDFLRMEGESQFMALLPKEARARERDLWYQGAKDSVKEYVYGIRSPFDGQTGIHYHTDNPKNELYDQLKRRLAKVADHRYDWTRQVKQPRVADQLKRLEGLKGIAVSQLPEVSILRIPGVGFFSLLRNSAHANITSLLDQSEERLPEQDTLTVAYGFIGDYPEMFIEVDPARLSAFVDTVAGLRKDSDYTDLVSTYGIRRTDARFWDFSDPLQDAHLKLAGVDGGLLDYNRYQNR
jgi:hypothetical protein